jgi:integrase
LYYRFTWQGITCSEFPRLPATPKNIKNCEDKARGMTSEMREGKFNYAYWFPNGTKKHLFLGRPDNRKTLRAFAENEWLIQIAKKVRPETLEEYKKILHVSIFPFIGDILLKDIREHDIDRYIIELKNYRWHRSLPINAQEIEGRPLSPRRMNIILLRLRQVLDLAFQRRYLDDDPHEWITLQEETMPEIDPLSFEERAAFIDVLKATTLPNREWVNYFTVAFDTGMSPSEQTGLTWKHVDFAHKKILIRQGIVRGRLTNLKTKARLRDLNMLPTVVDAMTDQHFMFQSTIGGPYIFPNRAGKPLDLANIRHRVWYPTLEKAGLKPRDLYQTRHTFASLMLSAGEDPAWIARMMGHSTTRMLFERYGKFIKNRTRQDGSAYLEALKKGCCTPKPGTSKNQRNYELFEA